jgi:hypothetical protein
VLVLGAHHATAADEGASHDRGHAEAELPELRIGVLRGGRRHVIEEPAVLVVREKEETALPLRARRQRGDDGADERLTELDVVVRVIVVGAEAGIDMAHLGEGAGGRVGEELLDLRQAAQLEEASRGPGEVAVIILVGHPCGVERAPDVLEPDHREVALLPLGRGAVEVETVRPGRAHDGRKPAIADCGLIRERVRDGELIPHVVAHHLVLGGSLVGDDEAVVLPHVPLLVGGVPAVRWIGRGVVIHLEDGNERAVHRRVRFHSRQPFDHLSFEELQGAQVMIEGAVLHHQHDEGVDLAQDRLGRERAHVDAAVDDAALAGR